MKAMQITQLTGPDTALALVAAADGDRSANELHYLRGLRAAEEAGDIRQIVRIRTNLSSHYIEEGRPEDALAIAEVVLVYSNHFRHEFRFDDCHTVANSGRKRTSSPSPIDRRRR